MSTLTDPPKGSFRPSQLLYDTRYRSITIQVIAAILILLGMGWLVNNTIDNLQALGKDFNFGFVRSVAGYDINQMLVDYDNQQTHGRAALVGILNTLLVAALGCITATVLGVIAGVLRLSKNWIVNKLMAVYVEGFRNVPLLLWIILIFAIMTESMPAPNKFRGDNPEASMSLFDSVAVTNRGVYIPALLFANGPSTTLSASETVANLDAWKDRRRAEVRDDGILVRTWMSFTTLPARTYVAAVQSGFIDWMVILGTLAISFFGARAVKRRALQTQIDTGVLPTTWHIRLAIWVIPTAIAMYLMGATINYPSLSGFNFSGGMHLRNSLIALWLALSLYTGAFIAEVVRAGILAVSKGQTEAAFALGIQPSRTMNLVILPQALRVIIPPLISQYLNLTKNSSLAIAVGYMDVRATLGGITINQTGRELEGMLLLGLFYLTLSLLISAVMNIYNNSTQLQER
ncbi:L-glutamine ABC transporter membrane protein/L-glutamate ABC transporter membrane protein/L-aspartate ABC transporter membrane protein/L-asparagine ABC transporter membrane protein [Cognatiyoonia koreensis]|uniref:L-glutamine ABC transporter membrane protein/L-glutamate ABC transporter membrane protein/L-aspartate ABC transporter membrane protein/L-asparagine ABC transporter membrane protein n=1 Tax=Cognatiyoonia koreensis TaxID=364200 RepID=A0A1I0S080_9RHOB|nr:ABC transporter permease subunit [Cognatiyoonia koreensis]SEW47365.1 L-glutamine ABC transporter membrane protein/L-glutamate ABC transporter membrane protein/L-aspartate ABC transporter membrane protein/L-asparagine ABC transporter membrane protein [Cognatiyoonia koreensis]